MEDRLADEEWLAQYTWFGDLSSRDSSVALGLA